MDKTKVHPKYLADAVAQARKTMEAGIGGPFGAAIVRKGKLIAVASNTVLKSHDPTAHAEVNAIRQASALLGTHDLSDCVIYATSAPCPMCRAAIAWANIKDVIYSNTEGDAKEIGFKDDDLYDYFAEGCTDPHVMQDWQFSDDGCKKLFDDYESMGGELY